MKERIITIIFSALSLLIVIFAVPGAYKYLKENRNEQLSAYEMAIEEEKKINSHKAEELSENLSDSDTADAKTKAQAGSSDGAPGIDNEQQIQDGADAKKTTVVNASSTVAPLKISQGALVDDNDNPVRLQGISSHGLSWFPEYVNSDSVRFMHDKWGINVIRLAMYTAEWEGYCVSTDENRQKLINKIDESVQYAVANHMYVIIDWHILSDSSPMIYKDQSVDFFEEVSARYSGLSNVIYEICNEPNSGTDWNTIKNYANEVIPVIRANSPDAVILVGTPNWCKDIEVAADDPLDFDNVMYTVHFYAASDKDELREKVKNVVVAKLPVFISEFGITDSSGGSVINEDEANIWRDMMEAYNISGCIWALGNKEEGCSIVKSDVSNLSNWDYSELKTQGQWFLREYLKKTELVK